MNTDAERRGRKDDGGGGMGMGDGKMGTGDGVTRWGCEKVKGRGSREPKKESGSQSFGKRLVPSDLSG
jgi:hypothetical protein